MTKDEMSIRVLAEERDWQAQLAEEGRAALRPKKAMAPQMFIALDRIFNAIDHRPDLLPAAMDHARAILALSKTPWEKSR